MIIKVWLRRHQLAVLTLLGLGFEAALLALIPLGSLIQHAGEYVALNWLMFAFFGLACGLVLTKRRPGPGEEPARNSGFFNDPQRTVLLLILGFALFFRLSSLFIEPTLSTDTPRYIWEGRLVLHGVSPYQYSPDDPALNPYHSPIWPQVGHRESTSPYPPLSQLIYAADYLIFGDRVLGPKVVGIFFDMLNCLALLWLLGLLKIDRRNLILYAWCPLPVIEFGQTGHNDAPMLFLMLIAIGLALQKRPLRSAVMLGLAALVKFTALFGLPIFLAVWAWSSLRPHARNPATRFNLYLRAWPFAVIPPVILAVGYVPFLLIGGGSLGTILEYTGTWRGNEAVWTSLLLDVLGLAAGKLITVTLLLGIIALLTFHSRLSTVLTLPRRLNLVFGATLLVASTVNQWYVTWVIVLIPLTFATDQGWGWDIGWLLFAALVNLSYLGDKFNGYTPILSWVRPVEYLPLLLFILGNGFYLWYCRQRPKSESDYFMREREEILR